MSAFGNKRNFDDVFERTVTAGFIGSLGKRIDFRYFRKGKDEKVDVPFYFRLAGSERFLVKRFLNDSIEDVENENAETQYDQLPRGIVTMSGPPGINVSARTSPIVNAVRVLENEDGQEYSVFSSMGWHPLNFNYTVEILAGSYRDIMFLSQELRNAYYVTTKFTYMYDNIAIPALWTFPESHSSEVPQDYQQAADKKSYKLSFDVELKTCQPFWNESTQRPIGNVITKGVTSNINTTPPPPKSLTSNSPPEEDDSDSNESFFSNGAIDK